MGLITEDQVTSVLIGQSQTSPAQAEAGLRGDTSKEGNVLKIKLPLIKGISNMSGLAVLDTDSTAE